MTKRFFQWQHSFKSIISIIRLIWSYLEGNIKYRRIQSQWQLLQSDRIDKWFYRRSGLSWASDHIVLSLDRLIKVIHRSYICQDIAIFCIQINHRTIIGSIILKGRIISLQSIFSYFLDIEIQGGLDSKSTFEKRSAIILFFQCLDDPLHEMWRQHRDRVLLELIIQSLDDRFFQLCLCDIIVFKHSRQCQIFSSIGILDI